MRICRLSRTFAAFYGLTVNLLKSSEIKEAAKYFRYGVNLSASNLTLYTYNTARTVGKSTGKGKKIKIFCFFLRGLIAGGFKGVYNVF
jgi:hypothetical protein